MNRFSGTDQHSGAEAFTRAAGAMQAVQRSGFLPPELRNQAHLDQPIELTAGQTCSQPTTVRAMLAMLDPDPGDTVLDVGSGSGWTTALLAHLVGPTGTVHGVELREDLATWGRQNVVATGMSWAHTHQAEPGVLGWPAAGPYQRILVSAEAQEVPVQLTEQLADGGRLVLPVRGTMTIVEYRDGVAQVVHTAGAYRFVPLR
ncbi:MAG TPA: protein-L-isoaspartate carboxylmethyltransferase [Candidatus Ruania gallistercoris]|uniref:Protein-L-isoaspartate O-methyltransferase n=1 Tax=Candidatus Ruania gallistercoris TaxID=2838746 RepID=A0A9D2ECG0_9MICO|nr:protein-L-isoaspartate carboxylmethyltransferase [Candidatus Ruania gallistercoris]